MVYALRNNSFVVFLPEIIQFYICAILDKFRLEYFCRLNFIELKFVVNFLGFAPIGISDQHLKTQTIYSIKSEQSLFLTNVVDFFWQFEFL